MKKTTKNLMLGLCILMLASTFVSAGDWPNWRGPNYDGISTETGLNTKWPASGPKVLWEAQIGIGFSAVSVANGKAYVMGNAEDRDTVFCYDATTGKEIWARSYDQKLDPKYYEGGTLGSPTVVEGKVYTISKDGITFCRNADNGDVVWKKDIAKDYGFKRTTWGYSCSPVIVGELALLNAGRYGLALSTKDGSMVWGPDKSPGGYASMVPYTTGGKQCAAMFGFQEIIGIEVATGKKLWEHTWKTGHNVNAADPIIKGDKVFISSGYKHGSAMLKISGSEVTQLWENKNMQCRMSGPVLIGDALYGPHESKGLQCIDAKTGELLWEEKEYKQGCVLGVGDKLIVLSQKGKLAVANASRKKFDVISSIQILDGRCWTVPTLANGKLYVHNSKGTLKCLDLSTPVAIDKAPAAAKETAAPYWPQWQGPKKDAKSTDTGLLKKWPENGPEMLWSVGNIGAGFSSVVVANGLTYISGMVEKQGVITAVEVDGKVKWRKPYGAEWSKSFPGARASATINGNELYILSGKGIATCMDAETGDKKWSVDVMERFGGKHHNWGYGESVLVVGDKVICTAGGEGASIVALNVKDGSTLWTTKELSEKASYGSPIVIERGGKKIIIQILYRSLVGVNAADGSVLFKYDTKDYKPASQRRGGETSTNTPVYHDGCIYLTSGYNSGSVKLKLSEDGTKVTKEWENHDLDVHHGGVVLVDGHLYGSNWLTNSKGAWVCVNWESGETIYEQDWDANKGSIGYADGMLYCYQERVGNLALVKATPDEFKIISKFKITKGEAQHWAHPVICGKVLYMRHGDVLMAYDVKK